MDEIVFSSRGTPTGRVGIFVAGIGSSRCVRCARASVQATNRYGTRTARSICVCRTRIAPSKSCETTREVFASYLATAKSDVNELCGVDLASGPAVRKVKQFWKFRYFILWMIRKRLEPSGRNGHHRNVSNRCRKVAGGVSHRESRATAAIVPYPRKCESSKVVV